MDQHPATTSSLESDNTRSRIYAAGAAACLATSLLIACAVILYFKWPYSPGRLPAGEILKLLAADPLGGLMSLDLSMLVIAPINLVALVALFTALEKTSRPFAVLGLISGCIGTAVLVECRPIVELFRLGQRYASVSVAAEKDALETIAESLLMHYDGTAWVVQTALLLATGLIFATLMLRSPTFTRADAWCGILVSAIGLGFFLPRVGILCLFLNTIGTVPWYVLVARRLWHLAQGSWHPTDLRPATVALPQQTQYPRGADEHPDRRAEVR